MIDDAGVVLRRRGALECVDLGFALLRADAGRHLRVTAGPAALVLALGLAAWLLHPWFGFAVTALFAPWTSGASTLLAGERLTRTPHPPGPDHPWRAALVLVRATWIVRAGLFLFAFVPPLVVMLQSRALFLPEVALLERPGSSVWSRAERLASRSSATTVPAALAILAIDAFGMLAGEVSGQFLATTLFGLGTPFGELFVEPYPATPYVLVGILAVQPLAALVRLAFYLETRTRAEGLDAYFALWATLGRA